MSPAPHNPSWGTQGDPPSRAHVCEWDTPHAEPMCPPADPGQWLRCLRGQLPAPKPARTQTCPHPQPPAPKPVCTQTCLHSQLPAPTAPCTPVSPRDTGQTPRFWGALPPPLPAVPGSLSSSSCGSRGFEDSAAVLRTFPPFPPPQGLTETGEGNKFGRVRGSGAWARRRPRGGDTGAVGTPAGRAGCPRGPQGRCGTGIQMCGEWEETFSP